MSKGKGSKGKRRMKLLIFCVLIPVVLTAIAIYASAETTPASINATFSGWPLSQCHGYPVGWWRSVAFQQVSPWGANPMYIAYDQAALMEDIAFFYIIFTVVMIVVYKLIER